MLSCKSNIHGETSGTNACCIKCSYSFFLANYGHSLMSIDKRHSYPDSYFSALVKRLLFSCPINRTLCKVALVHVYVLLWLEEESCCTIPFHICATLPCTGTCDSHLAMVPLGLHYHSVLFVILLLVFGISNWSSCSIFLVVWILLPFVKNSNVNNGNERVRVYHTVDPTQRHGMSVKASHCLLELPMWGWGCWK